MYWGISIIHKITPKTFLVVYHMVDPNNSSPGEHAIVVVDRCQGCGERLPSGCILDPATK